MTVISISSCYLEHKNSDGKQVWQNLLYIIDFGFFKKKILGKPIIFLFKAFTLSSWLFSSTENNPLSSSLYANLP